MNLPEAVSGSVDASSNWMGGQGWGHGDLSLDSLAVLLGDLGNHWGAVDRLDDLAGGDGNRLGDLLGGVDAHLLGHLTAVRLDGGVAVGKGSWGQGGGQGRGVVHVGGADGVPSKAQPWLSLSLPLDDGDGTGVRSAHLGGHILALLLKGDGLLLNIDGVTDILNLGNAVLGLDLLVGQGTLGGSDGDSSWGWGNSHRGSSQRGGSQRGAVSDAPGISVGRGSGTGNGGQARVGNKLVHGDGLDWL